MGRGLLSSHLQTNRIFFCVLAPDLFFGGPIVFKYMICLSIAIQNSHLMRYIISLNTHTISLRLPPLFFTIHILISLSRSRSRSLSLSLKGKGMLAKESSQVTALRYSTMLSSSSLSLSLSLYQRTQLSLHSRSQYSAKSQQHCTKLQFKLQDLKYLENFGKSKSSELYRSSLF